MYAFQGFCVALRGHSRELSRLVSARSRPLLRSNNSGSRVRLSCGVCWLANRGRRQKQAECQAEAAGQHTSAQQLHPKGCDSQQWPECTQLLALLLVRLLLVLLLLLLLLPQQESSEYTSDDESEEEGGRKLVKPVFVRKTERDVSPACL